MTRTPDERGVSTTLNYILNLSVTTILIAVLLTTGSGLVTDQRERVVRTELQVISQQLADDIAAADRLARSTSAGGTVEILTVESDYPRTVAGASYTISLAAPGGDRYELELSSSTPAVTVTVTTVSKTKVVMKGDTVGGLIEIEYTDTDSDGESELEVRSDDD
ncbi:hypothetical protein BRC77_03830 [Halobacteriales archaeon QH_8_64_26]|nr:MAG: hypothetical protein BRC77_03830 [Halobacteriales archaeon QH_8_64_26]